ncbi:MAG: NosD domain-containing protein [Candidatus Bathyarchaeia archaeon]
MKRTAIALILISALLVMLAVGLHSVKAGPKTIVVPDDYSTIEAAIENAADGDTIFVKKGIYEENPLQINKTLSLIGEGADFTKISFAPHYTDVTINIFERHRFYEEPIKVYADSFKMSGFAIITTGGYIRISGNGTEITGNQILTDIYVSGSRLNVTENNFPYTAAITGTYSKISANTGHSMWIYGSFCDISLNSISGSDTATGIWFRGNFSLIHDNNFTKAPYGKFSVEGNYNIIYRNIVDDAAFGLAVRGSNNTFYANRITNCGIGLENPESSNLFYANYVASNGWGINTGYNSTIATLYHNNFISNRYQVSTIFSSYPTQYFDNGAEGNYWSDYHGKDANGDGIGDTPYLIDANRSDRYPLMVPFNIESAIVELPEWASPPSVSLISPKNTTYTSANVTLEFMINKQTSWIGYSLDGHETATITGNTSLPGLSSGLHNVTLYAKDPFGNIVTYETIWFSVEKPFPTALVIVASVATVAIVIAGLIVYFKNAGNKQSDAHFCKRLNNCVKLFYLDSTSVNFFI